MGYKLNDGREGQNEVRRQQIESMESPGVITTLWAFMKKI
jgi:hypothetical protein